MRKTLVIIAVVGALGGAQSALAAGGSCPNPAFRSQAGWAIKSYVDADTISGALLVAVDGRPVLREGIGLANRELGVANTADLKFRIGSITKQFTATAILQLQEAGKLSLDDPVSKYYPAAPASWAKITIRHLLTHTSGIPSYTSLAGFFDGPARLTHTPEELIRLTQDKPLEFEPGSKFAYDNSGYILLGYIVEKASGQPYAAYLKQHIFGPLGMAGSGYDSSEIIPGRAMGYEPAPQGGWRNASFLDMSVPFAAGSLYSTVDDMLKWDQAIYAARLLQPASLKAMFTDYGNHYGFGWVIDQKWGRDRIWHNGGINGFVSSFQRYPKNRVTVVVLSNEITGAPDKLAADLAGLCLGAQVYPKAVAVPADVLTRYAGYYKVSPTIVSRIEVRGGALLSHLPGSPDLALYPEGEGKFFARTADVELAFQSDSQGRVTGVLVAQGGQKRLSERIDEAEPQRVAAAAAARAASGVASPGTEAALRKVIDEVSRGQPDYSLMSPALADATRQQLAAIQSTLVQFGAVKSVAFQSVGPAGFDIFIVTFEKGRIEWRIMLGEGGRIEGLTFRPAP